MVDGGSGLVMVIHHHPWVLGAAGVVLLVSDRGPQGVVKLPGGQGTRQAPPLNPDGMLAAARADHPNPHLVPGHPPATGNFLARRSPGLHLSPPSSSLFFFLSHLIRFLALSDQPFLFSNLTSLVLPALADESLTSESNNTTNKLSRPARACRTAGRGRFTHSPVRITRFYCFPPFRCRESSQTLSRPAVCHSQKGLGSDGPHTPRATASLVSSRPRLRSNRILNSSRLSRRPRPCRCPPSPSRPPLPESSTSTSPRPLCSSLLRPTRPARKSAPRPSLAPCFIRLTDTSARASANRSRPRSRMSLPITLSLPPISAT